MDVRRSRGASAASAVMSTSAAVVMVAKPARTTSDEVAIGGGLRRQATKEAASATRPDLRTGTPDLLGGQARDLHANIGALELRVLVEHLGARVGSGGT